MTKQYKELLLKDLCARLPYGVKVQPCSSAFPHKFIGYDKGLVRIDTDQRYELENIKPYLRPMSSMTKEELHEVQEILGKGVEIREDFILSVDSSINSFTYLELIAVFNFLNAHHFDYRGLIPKGLAIGVTEENNPYK